MLKLFVVGDSISIHYGPYLEESLQGRIHYSRKGNADDPKRSPEIPDGANGRDSRTVLAYLRDVKQAGGLNADILLLNCGLHDIQTDPKTQKKQVPIAEYEQNLRHIITISREMGVAPVWVRTTSVEDAIHNKPESQLFRHFADCQAYNASADKIMAGLDVPAIDLYTFTKSLGPDLYCDHVHFRDPIRRRQGKFIGDWLINAAANGKFGQRAISTDLDEEKMSDEHFHIDPGSWLDLRALTPRLPSVTSGHGLINRNFVCCDGRTNIRLSRDLHGIDMLVHYAEDSFFRLSRVLTCESQSISWAVDGESHPFEWFEGWAFGYENRQTRRDGDVISRCFVAQGAVVWMLAGVRQEAILTIPRKMFAQYDNKDEKGNLLEEAKWTISEESSPLADWTACRRENWIFRDSSTYAGIVGQRISSEPHQSRLCICARCDGKLQVKSSENSVSLVLRPNSKGFVSLALSIASDEKEAAKCASELAANPHLAFARQWKRYAKVDAQRPRLKFGRYAALADVMRLHPQFMESMRLADEPAAYRGNNDYYWVWGWDMTRPAFSLLCGNRQKWVRELLDFRSRNCWPDGESLNQYDNTLTKDLRVSNSLPTLELMLAHDYLAWTGDLESTQAWQPWLTRWVESSLKKADLSTGMISQAAASGDFPEEWGRTFQGWLSYFTGWQYAAWCCAEKLFSRWNNQPMAQRMRDEAAKLRANFDRVFWNLKTGFYNEAVHPTNPDLVCDVPLSTAVGAMDNIYGEDLHRDRLEELNRYCAREFLRDDGVHIVTRDEQRGWKEWTRSTTNWFAANDTMLARLFRRVGNLDALEKLFYLYEWNFGYMRCAFEGKPLQRPLYTSSSWQAFGGGAWYRNVIEAAAGLWVDLGGITLVPGGLDEPVVLKNLLFCGSQISLESTGRGQWIQSILLDGKSLTGTAKLPPLSPEKHSIHVAYQPMPPETPLLLSAADAQVSECRIAESVLFAQLSGSGYTPISFFSPIEPKICLNDKSISVLWDARTGRGHLRVMLEKSSELTITPV